MSLQVNQLTGLNFGLGYVREIPSLSSLLIRDVFSNLIFALIDSPRQVCPSPQLRRYSHPPNNLAWVVICNPRTQGRYCPYPKRIHDFILDGHHDFYSQRRCS